MQQERWRRIDEIFHSALELDLHHRASYLESTCSDDLHLRLEVERLLVHYHQAENFLEEPAIELIAGSGLTSATDLVIEGEMIAHYRVGAKLGSGGMGVVYEGEDLKLGRRVALKFLHHDLKRADHAISRLQTEARAASSLNHPNICTVYAIEEYRGQPVMVMERLEGQNLRERMAAGIASLEELVRLGVQACDALEAAHANGIVHRDIKPANIFATTSGRLKLLDFGVAKWMLAGDPEEYRGKIPGTMVYMSPEQLRGEAIDGRSDLFSLGVVLYELATGLRPFERGNPLLTMEAVLHDNVAAPSSLNPALPSTFDRVISQLLEKDRERRFRSAPDVASNLKLLSAPSSQPRRRRKLVAIAAGVFLVCGGAAIFFGSRPKPVLTDQDTIVLADFANQTGDPIFSETLRQSLAVELGQSPFLSLVSDERIQHMFQLMAKAPNTPLTGATARQVCERTGSAAVLDGSISSLGKKYVLLLRAQNCHTGDLLYAEQAETSSKEDVLRTLSRMAGRFRKRAGESRTTMAQHPALMSDSTTSSLEAWKTFSEGMRIGVLQGHAVAIPFFKRAIEIDPHFATAQAMLGRDYSAIGEMDLGRDYTRRAFNNRDRASDQERFFIDFSYDRLVTGNLEKALETCELWTHTYPRDVFGHALYGSTAKALGRFDKTMEKSGKAVEVDADQPYPYSHLATLAVYRGDFAEAQRWLQRASDRKLMIPDFLMIQHNIAFLQGNKAEMDRIGAASEHWSEIQDWIWGERAAVLAFSGRLKEARTMSQRAVEVALEADRRESAAQHEAASAVREALFGNMLDARRRAEAAQRLSHGLEAEYGAALALAFSGDSVRAQSLAKDLEQRYPEDTLVRFSFLPTLRSILAIQGSDPQKAVDLLGSATRYELGWQGCCSVGFVGSLYPIYARGEAYLAMGKGTEAAVEFQKIIDHRGIVGSAPIALLAHWRKGRALVFAKKPEEAKAEYQTFLDFWRAADPEIPILKRVKAEYATLARVA